MGTVTISSSNFAIYGTRADAIIYHLPGLDSSSLAFTAASDTNKDKGLVNATRLLDRVAWQGLPVGTPVIDSVLQWPRSGVVDRDDVAVSEASVPDAIIKATYILAGMIIEDPGVLTLEASGSNAKKVKAGPVEVEFWTTTFGWSGRFAVQIQELVGQYLAGMTVGSLSGSVSYGTDGSYESTFTDEASFGLNRGL